MAHGEVQGSLIVYTLPRDFISWILLYPLHDIPSNPEATGWLLRKPSGALGKWNSGSTPENPGCAW